MFYFITIKLALRCILLHSGLIVSIQHSRVDRVVYMSTHHSISEINLLIQTAKSPKTSSPATSPDMVTALPTAFTSIPLAATNAMSADSDEISLSAHLL